jgi:hypothetical protein
MKKIPLRSDAQYKFMKAGEELSYEIKNIISEEDRTYLYDYWKYTHADREFLAGGGFAENDNRSKKKGSLKYPYDWNEISHILEPIVERVLGSDNFKFISGRFYKVSDVYTWDNIHTDNWNYLKKLYPDGCTNNNGADLIKYGQDYPERIYMPWKTIVIPLYIEGSANTVVFDQFNYGIESVSWNRDYYRTTWPGSPKDYTEYMTGEMSISDEDYEKYLSHLVFDREKLRGLSIQAVHKWKLGNGYIWNSTQLHVPGKHKPGSFKVGLTIWTAYNEK